jgi:hypothetical protein
MSLARPAGGLIDPAIALAFATRSWTLQLGPRRSADQPANIAY